MNDCVEWNVPYADLVTAVYWASRRVQTSVDRRDMPLRSLIRKLDDKIMGDAATQAFLGYLASKGRFAVCYDQIRNDQARNIDPGWDVLSGATVEQFNFLSSNAAYVLSPEVVTYSVKSSRIPKKFSLSECVNKLDFKILKYGSDIRSDLRADFEVQIYFDSDTLPPEEVEVSELDGLIRSAANDKRHAETLAELVNANRFSKAHLCRFISRPELDRRWREWIQKGLPQVQKMRIGAETKEIWTAKLAWGRQFEARHECTI